MPKSKHAAGVNAALFKAMAHPLQGRIMVLLTEKEATPKQIADYLGEPLDPVAYQIRKMADPDLGLIELVRIEPARRGTQKVYKAKTRAILWVEEWEKLPRLVREINSVWVAQILIEDLRESIETGLFDARVGRALIRVPRVLDDQGWDELEPLAERYLEEADEISARSAARMARSRQKGSNFILALLAFEVPPPDSLGINATGGGKSN